MNRRYVSAFAALGLFGVMAGVMAIGFSGTSGCRADSWWTHDHGDFLQPYVVPAVFAFAGAGYFLILAATASRRLAIRVAIGALLVGGPGIWFLAIFEALTECPP